MQPPGPRTLGADLRQRRARRDIARASTPTSTCGYDSGPSLRRALCPATGRERSRTRWRPCCRRRRATTSRCTRTSAGLAGRGARWVSRPDCSLEPAPWTSATLRRRRAARSSSGTGLTTGVSPRRWRRPRWRACRSSNVRPRYLRLQRYQVRRGIDWDTDGWGRGTRTRASRTAPDAHRCVRGQDRWSDDRWPDEPTERCRLRDALGAGRELEDRFTRDRPVPGEPVVADAHLGAEGQGASPGRPAAGAGAGSR